MMKNPKCPSCGYELYDRTEQCPFCGADLPLESLHSIGTSTNQLAKIIALIAILLAISGVVFTYLLASGNEKTSSAEVQISEQSPQDSNAQYCTENMYRILDAEDEYMHQNGCFADNIDELAQFNGTLDIVCPESSLPYSIINTKQSVQVRCSVHGEM